MRKYLLLLALVAVGCAKDAEPINDRPVSNANNATSAVAANNDSNTVANNSAHNEEVYGVKNPDRIFQLDSLDKTKIKTPGGDLSLWIMDTEDKRREGMMFLQDKEVKQNEGMIFLFDKVQELKGQYAFWMQHTILPLDIVYISKDKKVVNVGKGKPFDESPVKPEGDYFYVIEVKQGLASKFGLDKGAKVDISSNLKGKP